MLENHFSTFYPKHQKGANLPKPMVRTSTKKLSVKKKPPDPLTRGSAPGPRWGLCPQTPVIASRSALAMGFSPPKVKFLVTSLAMADQHDSWDEADVQWDGAVITRIRAKETSGSIYGPGTCDWGNGSGRLETTSVSGPGAVHRDSSLLRLAGEDPDATLPSDPRRIRSGFSGSGNRD